MLTKEEMKIVKRLRTGGDGYIWQREELERAKTLSLTYYSDLQWAFRSRPLSDEEMAEIRLFGFRGMEITREEFNQLLLHQYMMKVAQLTGKPQL